MTTRRIADSTVSRINAGSLISRRPRATTMQGGNNASSNLCTGVAVDATRKDDPRLEAPRVSVRCGNDRNWRVSVTFESGRRYDCTFSNQRPSPKSVERYVRACWDKEDAL